MFQLFFLLRRRNIFYFFLNWHQPPDVSEPAVQVAGGAGESVRNQAVKAVEAVHQKLPLCAAFS